MFSLGKRDIALIENHMATKNATLKHAKIRKQYKSFKIKVLKTIGGIPRFSFLPTLYRALN